jgi:hypothetical protein
MVGWLGMRSLECVVHSQEYKYNFPCKILLELLAIPNSTYLLKRVGVCIMYNLSIFFFLLRGLEFI